ncbi:Bug family tripartite tricarboxylate transporter substrate binding protein [Caldimonas tepidiphila]|uniref:Bug family tripartite tricarboxylate transporter substrate binding protein n=1 Tax=Caldimonas tepidiphila TaxID=2315841 RepID=UPI000E5A44A3|nr:tripartite tricarboxylate transporter substrate binding protein [Caldimonas tepidiphila]
MSRRLFARRILGAALLASLAPAGVLAQAAYPTKPVTIIVPFSPGGGVDVMTRLLAEKLRPLLGQPVVIENKAGGSGMIGAVAAVRAPADGHTLLMATAGEAAVNQHVHKAKMQYSPDKDLAPVSLVVKVPNVLVVNPALPVKSVSDLLAHAKANPGKLSYGSSGIGNPQHLAGELLEKLSGVPLEHVPYRGASNQLTDTAGGSLDMTFVSLAGARPFLKDGRVRAIALTSPSRSSLAPELPAVSETKGLEGYALENWFGIFAPAGTPAPVVEKLHAALAQALKDPDLVKRMNDLGGEVSPMAPAQFRAFIQAESKRFARIVQDANITADN